MRGQQEGPVGNPSSPKKPRRRLTGSQSSSSSENGRGNSNYADDDSTWSWSPRRRSSSRVRPRNLGPRSWIVACTRINDRVVNDLAQLCTLKGQADELLHLSTQIVPSALRWGNWAFAFSKPESSAGSEKEGSDSVYDGNLERLTAEPDILVAELRTLQKALGAILPASRRISVDLGNLTSASGTSSRSGSVSGGGGSSRPTGTDVELEALRKRWAALSKRVASLSSHLDMTVKVAAEACRKSGGHPERPGLVARLKELVAEAQQGIISADYEDATLKQVLSQADAEDRPGPGVSSGRGGWKLGQNPAVLISLTAAEALRVAPVPTLVSETAGKIGKALGGAAGSVVEQLAWIPRTFFLSGALVYLRVYLVSMLVALPLAFYYFEAPPDIWL